MLLPIFGGDALWRKIVSFANVQIEESDQLPQKLCMVCARDVLNAAALKQKCEDSDKFFRNIIEASIINAHSNASTPLGHNETDVEAEKNPIFESSHPFKLLRSRQGDISVESSPFATIAPKESRSIETQLISSTTSLNSTPAENASAKNDKRRRRGRKKRSLRIVIGKNVASSDSSPIKILRSSRSSSSLRVVKKAQETTSSPQASESSAPGTPKNSRTSKQLKIANVTSLASQTTEGSSVPSALIASKHQCHVCQEFFAMKTILKHHLDTVHPGAQPAFECVKCHRTYSAKRFLDKHIRKRVCETDPPPVEKPEPPKVRKLEVKCASCGESFPSGYHLGWHNRGRCRTIQQMKINRLLNSGGEESTSKPMSLSHLDKHKLLQAKSLVLNNVNVKDIAGQLNVSEEYAILLRKKILEHYQKKRQRTLRENQPSTVAPPAEKVQQSSINSSNESRRAKPRKPRVSMDEAKFERAKALLAKRSATGAEIASQFNISLQSAFRVRRCILKDIPFFKTQTGRGVRKGNHLKKNLNMSSGSAKIELKRGSPATVRSTKSLPAGQSQSGQRRSPAGNQLVGSNADAVQSANSVNTLVNLPSNERNSASIQPDPTPNLISSISMMFMGETTESSNQRPETLIGKRDLAKFIKKEDERSMME